MRSIVVSIRIAKNATLNYIIMIIITHRLRDFGNLIKLL
jgi:hypothetical protein